MWRPLGQGEVYLYDQNRKNKCGDDYNFSSPGIFAIGSSNRITERVVINSPGKSDGLVEAWLNGIKKVSLPNLQLRGNVPNDSALVDLVSLETFYGGSTSNFAPLGTTHSKFSGFVVRKDLPDFTKPFVPIIATTTSIQKVQRAHSGSVDFKNVFTENDLNLDREQQNSPENLRAEYPRFDARGRLLRTGTKKSTIINGPLPH